MMNLRATLKLAHSVLDQNHIEHGFNLIHESIEVLQFSGIGYVNIILARRLISQKILVDANSRDPEDINL